MKRDSIQTTFVRMASLEDIIILLYRKSRGGRLTYNKNVITLQPWRFSDFLYENDTNPFNDWYKKEISGDARLAFDKTLKLYEKIEIPTEWPYFRGFLQGTNYKKHRIWEFGFFCDNRQYRVFGIFHGTERKRAIFLMGCYHKQKRYTPSSAKDDAKKRARLLEEGRGKLHERPVRHDL